MKCTKRVGVAKREQRPSVHPELDSLLGFCKDLGCYMLKASQPSDAVTTFAVKLRPHNCFPI